MKYFTFVLGLATFVAADIQILLGNTNDPVGGGTGQQAYFLKAGEEANCDNLGSPVIMKDDASGGGVACDGCGTCAPNDCEVTRFEIYDDGSEFENRQITTVGFKTLTLYQTDGDNYDLIARDPDDDDSQRKVGTCERRRGDSTQCPRGLTTDEFAPFFECFSGDEDVDLKE